MKRYRLFILIILVGLCRSAFSEPVQLVSAKQLQVGCAIGLTKVVPKSVDVNVNSDIFDIAMTWQCGSEPPVAIDKFEAEGSGPEIVTVFYRKNQIVVLARWLSKSSAADFQGYFYQVTAYDLNRNSKNISFTKRNDITDAFGDGYDGVMDGKKVTFPYTNAQLVRRRLSELGF
ncbi:UNVERIFIED_ORG: hypothetical protein J2Y81_002141 [Paraburkholderia sediminicola]|jgi:hypothetical protein|uniref:hypothetical protein n=1 Tax=Paraburkholderia aspalathi TaxID=1324617 RepID=UPI0021129F83|nr:hypothetical protein [Paraburkholderia sediminicola]